MSKIWVLHVAGKMSIGGVQSVLMNYYRNIDRDKIQFAFAVQRDYPMEYDAEILQLGGRIHYLPRLQENGSLFEAELLKLLKAYPEYGIVHAHFNHMNWKILKVAKKAGVRVRISHAHAAIKEMKLHTRIHVLYWSCLLRKYATHFVACSKESSQYLHLTDDSFLLLNALELSRFKFDPTIRNLCREQMGAKEGDILIGQVGHLHDVKNQLFSVDILNALENKYKLIVVGGVLNQDYADRLQEEIAKYSLGDRITLLGVRSDVHELLQAFDVLIFPSKHEGLGLICIEAQTAGLTVLSSDQVPEEVNVSGLVKFLPINKGIEPWLEAICSEEHNHKDVFQMVVDAGYEIHSATEKLEKFYLDLSKSKKQ